jgi:hypothetical protein
MRLLSRTIFREIFVSSRSWGSLLFTVVLFLQRSRSAVRNSWCATSGTPVERWPTCSRWSCRPSLPFAIPSGRAGRHAGHAEPHVERRRDHGDARGRCAGPPGGAGDPRLRVRRHAGWRSRASLWLTPWSIRRLYEVENQMRSPMPAHGRRRTARVRTRNSRTSILYVNDVTSGHDVALWKRRSAWRM